MFLRRDPRPRGARWRGWAPIRRLYSGPGWCFARLSAETHGARENKASAAQVLHHVDHTSPILMSRLSRPEQPLLRDRLMARLAEMAEAPDYPRLVSEVLGIRGAPAELARRLIEQAL